MTTPDPIGILIAWLRNRGEPDSGINYAGQSYSLENGSRQARVELFGSDADFVAKHFHGQGARDLADALSSIPAQPVGVKALNPDPMGDRMSDWAWATAKEAAPGAPRYHRAIARALDAAIATSHPAAVADGWPEAFRAYVGPEDAETQLAIALCTVNGENPDATVSIDGVPMQRRWMYYADRARAMLTFSGPGQPGGVTDRDNRQRRVAQWCAAAFGAEHQSSVPQRGLRMLEEAIEAYQALDGNPETAHKLIDYIFAKKPGELFQELGRLGITVLALAAAAGLSADEAERVELDRVLSKPLEWFHARNEAKNEAGFDASAYPAGPR